MKKLKTVLGLIYLVVISSSANSQTCSISISNNTNCTAHGYIEWYDCSSASCTYQPFTELAGSWNSVYTCSGCSTVCDVKFVLQYLGNTMTTWQSVDLVNPINSGASPCTPPTFALNLTINPTLTHLNINP